MAYAPRWTSQVAHGAFVLRQVERARPGRYQPCLNTSRSPSLTEVPHRLTLVVENIGRQEHSRFCFHLSLCFTALKQVRQIAAQNQRARFTVLCVLWPQADHIGVQIGAATSLSRSSTLPILIIEQELNMLNGFDKADRNRAVPIQYGVGTCCGVFLS